LGRKRPKAKGAIMAKQLKQIELVVRGPEGGPFTVYFTGKVGSTDDPDLTKPVTKQIEEPDLTKTVETFLSDEATTLKSDEGI
jgi:hypothetical protein